MRTSVTPRSAPAQARKSLLGGSEAVGSHSAGLSPGLPAGVAYLVKRTVDYVGAGVLVVLLAPLMAVIAVAIRATSDGPAIYAGLRMGRDGSPFRCLKFRTMIDGADRMRNTVESMNHATGPLFKIKRDPRSTPLGHRLRVSCLDELPQLFNVLRGEMSLVGPRPLPLRDCPLLPARAARRHDVLPGMTGLWQVKPDHHGEGVDIVELDLKYVDTWSPRLDAAIMWRTVGVLGVAIRAASRRAR